MLAPAMLRSQTLALLAALVLAAPARPAWAQVASPSDVAPDTTVRRPTVATVRLDTVALAAFVRAQVRRSRLPGVALAVVQEGRVVYTLAVGGRTRAGAPLTPDTPVPIGSTSKSFTALAIVQLAEAGRLDLDAPATRYLPELRFGDRFDAPTVRQLLHHTSGFREGQGLATLPDPFTWAEAPFARLARACAPGTCYDYCNLNYTLLGLIIEAVSGQPYADYVAAHLAAPLGLTHTSATRAAALAPETAQGHRFWYLWTAPAGERGYATASVPAGFIVASARDLGALVAAQVDTAALRRLGVGAAALEAMRHPATGGEGYGMGWRSVRLADGSRQVQHTGLISTSGSAMAYAPERGYGVAVVVPANSLSGPSDIARGALAVLRGEHPVARRPGEVWWRAAALFGTLGGVYSTARAGVAWHQAGHPLTPRTDARALGKLAWDVAVPTALVVGLPIALDTPLHMMLHAQPDLGYALVGGAALGIATGLLRVLTPRR